MTHLTRRSGSARPIASDVAATATDVRDVIEWLLRRSFRRRRWGHQRARLPGRERLRELAASPGSGFRSAIPAALWRTAKSQPDGRMIGLLMVRDEDDIIAEMLACAVQWFDRILVLDGTTDVDRRARTDAVLASTPEVVFVARDEDVPGPGPVRDGARQLLLDEARRRYGTGHWIGVLHADEFMDQDPRPMLAAHNPVLDPTIRVRVVHAFLHLDDEEEWRRNPDSCMARPIRDRVRHAMWPGVPETRFFFDRGQRDYRIDHHSKTVPTSFRAGPLEDGYTIVQYNERNPDQALDRAVSRMGNHWQSGHYARFVDEVPAIFVQSLDSAAAPFVPEYRGDPHGPFRAVSLDDVPVGPLPPILALTDAEQCVVPDQAPSVREVLRWWASHRPADGDADVMLFDHTARLLVSRRLTDVHKQRVAAEYCALRRPSR